MKSASPERRPPDPGERSPRRLGDHVAEVLDEPEFRAGLARGRQLALVRRALREVCGQYAVGARPIGLREGRLRVEVPNSTALQFLNLNERAVIARARRLGVTEPIRELSFAISPAPRAGGTHGH